MGAQPAKPRGTGSANCAGNARLLAAPNRYLAAGSTAGSCLLEALTTSATGRVLSTHERDSRLVRVWEWLTDLLFLGATEDAARRSTRYRRRVERAIVAFSAVAVLLVITATLMLLFGR